MGPKMARGTVKRGRDGWWAKNLTGTCLGFDTEERAVRFSQSRTEYYGRGCAQFHYPPDPRLEPVTLGPCWANEIHDGMLKRLPPEDDTPVPDGFLSADAFSRRLIAATNLRLALFEDGAWKEPCPVRIVRCSYGGGRFDRLGARNRFSNALGFPECTGNTFLSVEEPGQRSGWFFSDFFSAHKEYGARTLFYDGDEPLRVVHGLSRKGGTWSSLEPIVPEQYAA